MVSLYHKTFPRFPCEKETKSEKKSEKRLCLCCGLCRFGSISDNYEIISIKNNKTSEPPGRRGDTVIAHFPCGSEEGLSESTLGDPLVLLTAEGLSESTLGDPLVLLTAEGLSESMLRDTLVLLTVEGLSESTLRDPLVSLTVEGLSESTLGDPLVLLTAEGLSESTLRDPLV